MTDRYLSIYLRDHLAAATAGLEVIRRVAGENENNSLGRELALMADELDEERQVLLEILELLDVEPSQLKIAGAWLAEKAARLKLNGELIRYSPLSRVLELEGLMAAVTGRKALWETLMDAKKIYPELRQIPARHFVERAEEQREELERMHRRATRHMLKSGLGEERGDQRPGAGR